MGAMRSILLCESMLESSQRVDLRLQIRHSIYNWKRHSLNVALAMLRAIVKEKVKNSVPKQAIADWATKAIQAGGIGHWEKAASAATLGVRTALRDSMTISLRADILHYCRARIMTRPARCFLTTCSARSPPICRSAKDLFTISKSLWVRSQWRASAYVFLDIARKHGLTCAVCYPTRSRLLSDTSRRAWK